MSFIFNWTGLDEDTIRVAKCALEDVLNRGDAIGGVVGGFEVKEFNIGSVPPEVQLIETTVAENGFKTYFKISYNGDFRLELKTTAQINKFSPTNEKTARFMIGVVSAHKPSLVPLRFTIHQVHLNGILMVHLLKDSNNNNINNINIRFLNDPLQSVVITSSLEYLPIARTTLKRMVENHLRTFLVDKLPLLAQEIQPMLNSIMEKKKEEKKKDVQEEYTKRYQSA